MNPKTVKTLVDGWHHLLASKNVRFNVKDYREITAQEGDVVYADPPYKTSGEYYFGMIDFDEFFGWLRTQKGSYLLSLNGFQDGRDRTVAVPTDLYNDNLLIKNGVSPFERLNGDDAVPVQDSLYIRTVDVQDRPITSAYRLLSKELRSAIRRLLDTPRPKAS
jgi:hypothetical protein